MFRKTVFCLLSTVVAGLLSCQSDTPRQPASAPAAPAAAPPPSAPAASSGQPRTTSATAPAAADTSFLATWQQFDRALRQSDSVALQALIDPAAGLWILEQPGAMPLLTHVVRTASFRREYQQQPLFSLVAQLMPCATPHRRRAVSAFRLRGPG
ncbi:hypothetical protein LRS06_05705 [Hymenobacter sp. J193]|uniref:hypothetical protein n=1 Tax=Hymenobacter sp. J193 TaxID=2898429 RepID=UPI002151F9B0|nr:hypothetical protein [Hymenobacter sp. J193]MCR5887282.1 hypothetical protein [Hymenobacter sp. J193]